MEPVIIRTYYPGGTNGDMLLNGVKCHSIELPWLGNHPQTSCIPEGRYELKKRFSLSKGWHLQVLNVPDRDLILIHAANDAIKELKGCIAPVSELTGEGKGSNSRAALKLITDLCFAAMNRSEPVFLTIKSHAHVR